ncbi:hypothetical protein OCH239_14845 [Roseivivax halodurans JCM 10272]|uniref:DUF2726 domain-containing protein n=1 Tax=Roseivivax halodurans JCM 10272 TaxID=1449350 RepID=X7ED03_9RHOB|nr:DUF2726 domain-containing protein [Roseivivax halodurans]ETX12993.1 hypothetical protein OCH239_14845 [Roseivivax halodurans JCM 10272]
MPDIPDFLQSVVPLGEALPYLAAALLALLVAAMLRAVFAPRFEARPLLGAGERRVFAALKAACPPGWSVFPQVSYGEILRCRSRRKYFTINARRADFVICDASFEAVAVVEYQGAGHWGETRSDRRRAERGDRAKRRALREASVPLIEVPARFDATWLRGAIDALRA